MKPIWFLIGIALCGNANANVTAFGGPTIDTRAPGYFASLVARSDYLVIPRDDSTRDNVVVRDRVNLDQFAGILEHAIYEPSGHILATTAGDPITFFAADKQRVLTFERFGEVLRLNGGDYRVDKKALAALAQWFKKAEDNQPPDTTRGK